MGANELTDDTIYSLVEAQYKDGHAHFKDGKINLIEVGAYWMRFGRDMERQIRQNTKSKPQRVNSK